MPTKPWVELVNTTDRVSSPATTTIRGQRRTPGATHVLVSGDLAYRDSDGWIYLAGRTADWMRVDGRISPPRRSSGSCCANSSLNRVAWYAVPDGHVGDQVMAAVVLNDGHALDPDAFEAFLDAQPDCPQGSARYVRIAIDLPARHPQGAQAPVDQPKGRPSARTRFFGRAIRAARPTESLRVPEPLALRCPTANLPFARRTRVTGFDLCR